MERMSLRILLWVGLCTYVGAEELAFSDERLKANITSADLGSLLAAIEQVELREFDFKYEQFYNPIFGKHQLGIIAQELARVLPSAVGVVGKRMVGEGDVLEQVHVLNSEALFMASLGATKELARLERLLEAQVQSVVETIEGTTKDIQDARRATQELGDLKNKQSEVERLAKEAHSRSEHAIRMEKAIEILEKEGESQRKESQSMLVRLEKLDDKLSQEIQGQGKLHEEISTETQSLQGSVASLGTQIKDVLRALQKQQEDLLGLKEDHANALEDKVKSFEEKHTSVHKQIESLAAAHSAGSGRMQEQVERLEGLVDGQAKEIDALRERLTQVEKTLESSLEQTALVHKSLTEEMKRLQAQTSTNLTDLAARVTQVNGTSAHALEHVWKQLGDLQEEVNKQAGQEIVEQRKILEAQVELERAKADVERTKAEEQRKTAEMLAQIETDKYAKQENVTLERIQKEEAIRAARQLDVIQAEKEAKLREHQAKAQHEREMELVKAQAKQDSLRLEATIAKEKTIAQVEAETKRERENHDLHLDMARLEAEQAREHTVQAIQAAAHQLATLARYSIQSPVLLLKAIGMMVLLAFGVYGVREGSILLRSYWQQRLGQPSLIRETSLGSNALKSSTRLLRVLVDGVRSATLAVYRRISPLSVEEVEVLKKEEQAAKEREHSFLHFMSDVVLPPAKADQINRIARATRAAHQTKTPLRHVLFYGPPGTGKTMVARSLSQWCGLDYAIMSGADVAPLKDRAVTELHELFEWAKKTPRGLLLFIDEADAFLASRDGGQISETLRNALTAVLFHTGSLTSKVMLVLATNRPGDLDKAVLDRIDESVQFNLPSTQERHRLVRQYFEMSLIPYVSSSQVDDKMLDETTSRTEGFSGREIAKLMTSVQAHLLGSDDEGRVLTSKLFRQVLTNAVEEHAKLEELQHQKHYRWQEE